MSSLVNVLYPLPALRRSPMALLRWWESRRLFYNAVVGGTGLVTLGGCAFFFSLPPNAEPVPGWFLIFPVIAYGVMANACYTLGWLVELLAGWVWGDQTPDMGPLLFRQGLIFSVGLTLLPLGLSAMIWVLRIAAWLVS